MMKLSKTKVVPHGSRMTRVVARVVPVLFTASAMLLPVLPTVTTGPVEVRPQLRGTQETLRKKPKPQSKIKIGNLVLKPKFLTKRKVKRTKNGRQY